MRRTGGVLLALALGVASLAAQGRVPGMDAMTQALNLERRGAWNDAATLYLGLLRARPADADALMGLERVLPRADRRRDLILPIETALAADSANSAILGVAVRAFAGLGLPDSARKYVLRWAVLAPGDESPYREWADAATVMRDLPQAHAALDLGRKRLGSPALALEIAQLAQAEADYPTAIREWLLTLRESPYFLAGAASVIGSVPLASRTAIRDLLNKDPSAEARRLLGLLEARWGEPARGLGLLAGAMPSDSGEATAVLQGLLEILRSRTDRASLAARGGALELLADRQHGGDQVTTRMDAARAYADGGAEQDARRMLGLVAADSLAPASLATTASATLLGVLLAEGKAAEAERIFTQLAPSLSLDQRDLQARHVAEAWVRQGEFPRAEKLVGDDSTVAGLDLRGRIRLYQGDLAGASALLKAAGPYDDDQANALERVTLLTLMQSVGKDSLPALGAALLLLERGDSAGAVAALDSVAGRLEAPAGAELHLLAGRVALARLDSVTAARLFRAADVAGAPGVAAEARLALARLDAAAGRTDAARAALEKLILDFPESAVVPDARRLRDQLRGALPPGGR
jgi:hypothetical protein